MKNNLTTFQPVVEDDTGKIRKQFAALHEKTKISKKTLAAKVFELGLAKIAESDQLTIQVQR